MRPSILAPNKTGARPREYLRSPNDAKNENADMCMKNFKHFPEGGNPPDPHTGKGTLKLLPLGAPALRSSLGVFGPFIVCSTPDKFGLTPLRAATGSGSWQIVVNMQFNNNNHHQFVTRKAALSKYSTNVKGRQYEIIKNKTLKCTSKKHKIT